MIHRFYIDISNLDRQDAMAYLDTMQELDQSTAEYGPFVRYTATEGYIDPDTHLFNHAPCLIYEIDSDDADLSDLANLYKDVFHLDSVIWAIVPMAFKL